MVSEAELDSYGENGSRLEAIGTESSPVAEEVRLTRPGPVVLGRGRPGGSARCQGRPLRMRCLATARDKLLRSRWSFEGRDPILRGIGSAARQHRMHTSCSLRAAGGGSVELAGVDLGGGRSGTRQRQAHRRPPPRERPSRRTDRRRRDRLARPRGRDGRRRLRGPLSIPPGRDQREPVLALVNRLLYEMGSEEVEAVNAHLRGALQSAPPRVLGPPDPTVGHLPSSTSSTRSTAIGPATTEPSTWGVRARHSGRPIGGPASSSTTPSRRCGREPRRPALPRREGVRPQIRRRRSGSSTATGSAWVCGRRRS